MDDDVLTGGGPANNVAHKRRGRRDILGHRPVADGEAADGDAAGFRHAHELVNAELVQLRILDQADEVMCAVFSPEPIQVRREIAIPVAARSGWLLLPGSER
jgi:hypothetical protein